MATTNPTSSSPSLRQWPKKAYSAVFSTKWPKQTYSAITKYPYAKNIKEFPYKETSLNVGKASMKLANPRQSYFLAGTGLVTGVCLVMAALFKGTTPKVNFKLGAYGGPGVASLIGGGFLTRLKRF
jgi:hypothetical protein